MTTASTSFRLLTFATPAGPRAGVVLGERLHVVAEVTGVPAHATLDGVLQDWDAALDLIGSRLPTTRAASVALAGAELLLPFRPGAIYCVGANFQDHIDAIGVKYGMPPAAPQKAAGLKPFFFLKASHCAVGPDASVKTTGDRFDYEVELAAVIGRRTRDIGVAQALDAVAAYTVANDLSARDRNVREAAGLPFRFDWIGHKTFDGSCPIGPWLTPAAEVADPQDLSLKTWVNGELRQDGSTRDMIFSLAEQIAHLSSRQTLYPGDIILTGTPSGVAAETDRYLQVGDEVLVSVGSLGELRTRVAGA